MDAATTTDSLRRSDIPHLLSRMQGCTVGHVREHEGVPQAIAFDFDPFAFQVTTAAASNEASDDDLERVCLWAAFNLDPVVDLELVNAFNRTGYATSVALADAGIELHDHFIVGGLDRSAAEALIERHILGFRREVHEFNLARNERARSLSDNV